MSADKKLSFENDLFHVIEPLFIEHFKLSYGNSPSLPELKQHLVLTPADKLIEHISNLNSRITEIYSHSDISKTINLYIRKLK